MPTKNNFKLKPEIRPQIINLRSANVGTFRLNENSQ